LDDEPISKSIEAQHPRGKEEGLNRGLVETPAEVQLPKSLLDPFNMLEQYLNQENAGWGGGAYVEESEYR